MHTWEKFSASQLKYTILLFDIVFGKLIWQIALQCFHWSHGSMNFLQFTYCLSLLKYICHFVYKLNMYLPAAKVITLPFANHILPKIKLFKFSPRDHWGLNPWILHLKNIIRDIIIVFPTPNSMETLSLLHILCSFQSFFILLEVKFATCVHLLYVKPLFLFGVQSRWRCNLHLSQIYPMSYLDTVAQITESWKM